MQKYILLWIFLLLVLAACGTQTDAPTDAPTNPSPVGTTATQMPPTAESATSTGTASATSEPITPPTVFPPTARATDEPATEQPAAGEVSFVNDVFPIIESRCINCHGGEEVEDGLDMKTYAGLMAGSENGLVVIPGDAANSLFVTLVQENEMPKRGPKLAPAQVQIFVDWVNQGALNN